MKIALFGFPMTGKSTMFRLLTGVEPSPHATPGEAQAGVARVADPRLCRLADMYSPKKKPWVPWSVEYSRSAKMLRRKSLEFFTAAC